MLTTLGANTPTSASGSFALACMTTTPSPLTSPDLEEDPAAEGTKHISNRWRRRMEKIPCETKATQIAIYLLVWGEGLTLRYTPECLCFIFKLCLDHFFSQSHLLQPAPEGDFLKRVVTPLYNYIRDQGYEVIDGRYFKRERDHSDTIGYDDVNEFFWSRSHINRITLVDKQTRLMKLPLGERYSHLGEVAWKRSFCKTYKERRTAMHLLTNFSRIWVFHLVVFYYYLVYNAEFLYQQYTDTSKRPIVLDSRDYPAMLSLIAMGGGLGCLIVIVSSICELMFLPSSFVASRKITFRIICLVVLLVLCCGPFVYIQFFNRSSAASQALAIIQLVISVLTTVTLSVVPSNSLFTYNGKDEEHGGAAGLTHRSFTANYPALERKDRALSLGLWGLIIMCKLVESYFFIALSFKDMFRAMLDVDTSSCRDAIFGRLICSRMGYIALGVMTLLDLILFFLDTYFWYVVWNSIFSVAYSFYMGISILSPWRNIFSRLPKRIHAKVLATADMDVKYKPKFLTSQIWNSIVISMYRDHLLSIDHLQRLLYQQVPSEQEGKRTLKPPTFFVAQEDQSMNAEFFPAGSEAERRISFFAQSLSTVIPEPVSIESMPSFSVFTPHYGEKILLSLREIIREDSQNARVTLLEYLKSLHHIEWCNFVKDTKTLEQENALYPEDDMLPSSSDRLSEKSHNDDLPLYCIGFKSASPEYILRTRIWASLRSQTLYRTISGFMNYARALKTLYRVENPEMVRTYTNHPEMLQRKIDNMIQRKFRFVIAMQRYTSFNDSEREDVDFLLKAYPTLQIAYLAEENEGEDTRYFSCLIDGFCPILDDGSREPRFKIELPGHPILGDGKSDNQNQSIIFTRGEYMQLIDANQDHYLEEAMKVRSMLAEFEGFTVDTNVSPYSSIAADHFKPPVAIVGAREYIFSENIGVLGDVAAGKEQTFGTMTQRIMAKVGGKLHYGHPDFLNSIFMTTRGGISKAQKGLHLNEDIFAGMNAFQRGGRIKHTEYYQCGKGRDMGFSSVLSFNTKIGTGMGEQMLSREQYYLGTQLPLDRFLTFYFAHPGFHVNNVMIMLATQLIVVALLFISALSITVTPLCLKSDDPEATPTPEGCFNLRPIISWIVSTIISIFIVFGISYLPLFLQVFTEQGFTRTVVRLGKHFASLSPIFEIFVNQIYATSLLNNLSYGGATYIATGRGFATTRTPFATLYSRFASSSIYTGVRLLFMLLFVSIAMWVPHYIYFWVVALSLCLAPFLFNPHQFSRVEFILDYADFLRWLSAGNVDPNKHSWVAHCRLIRTRITGFRRTKLGQATANQVHLPRAHTTAIFIPQVLFPIITAMVMVLIYSFIGSMEGHRHGVARAMLFALGPVALNAAILLLLFPVSFFIGPILNICFKEFGSLVATIAHGWAVINLVAFFLLLLLLEKWNISYTILGVLAGTSIQRALFQIITALILTRESHNESTNIAWWSGKWLGHGLGVSVMYQPFREFFCKVIELSLFSADFVLGHFLLLMLFPLTLIPLIDQWHTTMLFWLRPSKQMRTPIYSIKQNRRRRRHYVTYLILFLAIQMILLSLFVAPSIAGKYVKFNLASIDFVKRQLI
ncbi:1,3-beta-D-glucan synthase [Entomophthora muscae]|uniref:1,3-beta-D-glucan synthase n=2 Tax=Entomophthora muscae TaxID=34485 RepID=A0ACC2RS27_9FUNG|nr:1,3-beta-D-glucan synthase [Entomophthora muscae]